MYSAFYGLAKKPFHITPDPEFLYLSPSHKEALGAIIYGIEQRKGFVAITGAVGVGKTTILRSYLERAEREHLKIIYVFNAKLTFGGLLKTIYDELALPVESTDVVEMVNSLYQVLIDEYTRGNIVVLVVDEAQNMPVETLESLRMISNLETSKDKLIQIVLVGQPEFEDELNLPKLRQLKQRLAVRSTIRPLTRQESLDYIGFRLEKAGSSPAAVFTAPALKKIIKRAHGIPRLLNVLCDNALITGFGYERKPVTKKIVTEIIKDFDGSRRWLPGLWWRRAALTLGLIVACGIAWSLPWHQIVLWRTVATLPHEQREPDRAVKAVRPVERPAALEGLPQQSAARVVSWPSSMKERPTSVTRTVARGDTLLTLAKDVYGDADAETVKLIQEVNPRIADPDLIAVGSTITFPKLPERGAAATSAAPRISPKEVQ
ncbi:MAG: AAA family ATPase [Syntrophorhabdales bacterium]|jgi:general secretion pathway protein A